MPRYRVLPQLRARHARNPERTAALRHLLEAKDCAVRSVLPEAVVTTEELE